MRIKNKIFYRSMSGLSFSGLGACSLEGQGHNSNDHDDGDADDDGDHDHDHDKTSIENLCEKTYSFCIAQKSILKEIFSAGLAFSSSSPVLMSTRKLICEARPLKFHPRRSFLFFLPQIFPHSLWILRYAHSHLV